MPKNKEPIPEEFVSIADAGDFWDRHSTADYSEEMQDVDIELSPTLRAKIEIKKLYSLLDLSPSQASKIEERARSENLNSRQLICRWVLEHI